MKNIINKIASGVSLLKEKITAETKDTKSNRGLSLAPDGYKFANKEDRFFYKNFLTAKQKRAVTQNIIGKQNPKYLSKEKRDIIKSVLDEPKNIPYRYGSVPVQHAGNATPIQFLTGISPDSVKHLKAQGIELRDDQIRGES